MIIKWNHKNIIQQCPWLIDSLGVLSHHCSSSLLQQRFQCRFILYEVLVDSAILPEFWKIVLDDPMGNGRCNIFPRKNILSVLIKTDEVSGKFIKAAQKLCFLCRKIYLGQFIIGYGSIKKFFTKNIFVQFGLFFFLHRIFIFSIRILFPGKIASDFIPECILGSFYLLTLISGRIFLVGIQAGVQVVPIHRTIF